MEKYVKSQGLYWDGVLKGFPKSSNPMQPLFEAITNSFESVDMRKRKGDKFEAFIYIDFYFNKDLENNNDGLYRISITDNGIGFDNKNFERLTIFKDDRKGYGNRGSGRIQFIHSFIEAEYDSIYEENKILKQRIFTLSKSISFLVENSIIRIDKEGNANDSDKIRTVLQLKNLRLKTDLNFFNQQDIDSIKSIILDHYILYFCTNKDKLPKIKIRFYQCGNILVERNITNEDIPTESHEDVTVNVPISQISPDMKRIENIDKFAEIKIRSYKLPVDKIKKNEVKICCKDEVVESVKLKLECLPSEMQIDDKHFLFILSSDYFDDRTGDDRNYLEILNKAEFKKRAKQYGTIESQIVLENLEKEVSNKASEIYSEIASQKEIHEKRIENLKKTYMLSDEALQEADINDSVEDILKKAYIYDAKIIAERDAEYDKKQEALNKLDTSSPTYRDDLQQLVNEISRIIPLQDKESLSRYITHRQLVLNLMSKILHRETDIQNVKGTRNEDEKLIHNLLFTQHSENSNRSDLWMLNEDYLYYKGFSEHKLNQIEINGEKLFREEITEEEERYLTSLNEDRRTKRPDILLFPTERKCIIIELKTPNTNLANHINQVKKYAYLLRNFTTSKFVIDTFYGYLIGESFEPRDVRAVDSNFLKDPVLDCMYLQHDTVACDNEGQHDGSLYMEVLKYSDILKRAEKRNKSFTSILFPDKENTLSQKD